VDEIAKKTGFDDKARSDLGAAVTEAVANVVEHAYEPAERATIVISCERVPLGLKIAVRDKGIPFDATRDPACEAPVESGREVAPGCGIVAMKEFMDEVHFNNLGLEGKETVLIKYLHDRDITDYYAACELEPYVSHASAEPLHQEPIEFTVRSMLPSDAVEVSRCAYRAYGYTHTSESIYYPDRIVRLNESGLWHSVVAVTRDGDIAGHGVVMKHHEQARIAELALGAVKPEYRSHGVFLHLTDFLIRQAMAQRLIGVYAQAVTVHPYSQMTLHRFGFSDCAILLGFVPATARFKAIKEHLTQRETLAMAFRYLGEPWAAPAYVPPHHLSMIERLYAGAGARADIRSASEGTTVEAEESRLRIAVVSRMGHARIEVEAYGQDIVARVKATLRDLCLKHVDVIHLHLDLSDPPTSRYVQEFEGMGFFFAGILPGEMAGDALILQYLNNVPLDYDKIKIDSDTGRELLEYVKAHDPNRA